MAVIPQPSPGDMLYDFQKAPSDLVSRIFEQSSWTIKDMTLWQKRKMVEKFGRFPGDVGRTSVQIATLTVDIEHFKRHYVSNKGDKMGLRRNTTMTNHRKRLLLYLQRKDPTEFGHVVRELQLQGDIKDVLY